MDIFSYCHFYNASKECFLPQKISNFMHGFKSAILTIFHFFQKLEVASFLPSKSTERQCEMIQINMFSFLFFFSEKWWTSLAKFYMRRPLPWSHWTSQGNPTVPGGQLGPFWTSGGSVRLQEISCAKWLSISHLNGMTHNWAEWQKPTKICEIDVVTLMPATFWQIFNMKRAHVMTGNGN